MKNKTGMKIFTLLIATCSLLIGCENPFWPEKKEYVYTVTFCLNDGTDAVHAIKTVTTPERTIDSLPVEPTRFGYTFNGWNTAANGSGSTFNAGTKVTGNINIYAQWKFLEMVRIPGAENFNVNGQYVKISSFYLGKYEVTQEQYQTVMTYNPSHFIDAPASGEVQGKRPVESVTWFDAIEFCNKLSEMEGLESVYTITGRVPVSGYPITDATVVPNWTKNGYRLPTEVQWQYAAQSGTSTEYTANPNNAWTSENSNSRTHQVGLKEENAFGLYDMLGNVFEWCWDWYNTGGTPSYPSDDEEPKGPDTGTQKVYRGGSFYSTSSTGNSSYRNYQGPDQKDRYVGFRVARR